MYCIDESPHKGRNTSVVVCVFDYGVCRFSFTTSERLVWGFGLFGTALNYFLAHSATIIGSNIVI